MINLKNNSAQAIEINYDSSNITLVESFSVGGTYDILEIASIRYSKGCAEIIKNVLEETLEVRLDGVLVEKSKAAEYIIEANKIELSKTSAFSKVTEREKLYQGLAGGFLYVKNCSIG